MEKEFECISLENNVEYVVVEKIKKDNFYYLYLFNVNDVKDFCIRKLVEDKLCGLSSNEEFNEALLLVRNKNKDLIEKIGL